MLIRWLKYLATLIGGVLLVSFLLLVLVFNLISRELPPLTALTDYQPKIPLRIYSAEGELLGEFGEERRSVVNIKDVPAVLKQAILAAEDDRFYQHGGVDYLSILRAAHANLVGGSRQGAGTITMQVARNFFLTREKTITRKLREVILAYKIEANLSKDQILELYINQIYLGQRAYGFAAAAQIYFDKPLDQIGLAEATMLAGLPKSPSAHNPVSNLNQARKRQRYVLSRMHALGYISNAQLLEAEKTPLQIKRDLRLSTVKADYIAEMARQAVFEAYGEEAYSRGIQVFTTVQKVDQEQAYSALRKGVLDYERRHGYRGPELYVNLPKNPEALEATIETAFEEIENSDDILAALVLDATPTRVQAILANGETIEIHADGLKFAQKSLSERSSPNSRIRRGAVIRVQRDDKGQWAIVQLPQVEAAFISMDPHTGALRSLIGGFDFYRNNFNHVTQAQRQPGSSFKPFIYSAALEKGFSPATIVNDGPLYFDAEQTGSAAWEPKNYDGKFDGPLRLRTALMKSKNLVSVRVLQAISPSYAQDYVTRFGFDPKQHPAYLTMALGAGSVTPWQMVTAYAVFANGGYRVHPYFIERIVDSRGNTLLQHKPQIASEDAERVIDPRNAFIMTSLMRDVVRGGTATRAMSLGRQDLAGKTGTTNDHLDAWFAGFNSSLVAVSWIGFDQPKPLGAGETGAVAALPIWINYMGKVLKNTKEQALVVPQGVVIAKINPETGFRDAEGKGIPEYFYQEYAPRDRDEGIASHLPATKVEEIKNQLF